jgi:uncharacterized membrane protein
MSTTPMTHSRHAATAHADGVVMPKLIATDPCEFHRMMDEEKALAAEAAVTIEHPPEIVWSDWSYAPWRKLGRLSKNTWRAKKRERAAQRRKRWMVQNPGK